MRISDGLASLLALCVGLGVVSAIALDGRPSDVAPGASLPSELSDHGAPTRVPLRGADVPRPPAPIPGGATALRARPTPFEAFRSGTQLLRAGETAKAVTSLQYAAEQGHPAAQWKLGRMYAEGEGVPRSDLRAFDYFSRVANAHADDNPYSPHARFVANAFVALGHYYLHGIPNSAIKADPERAQEMFAYAASYFGDAEAQYNLARLYLSGKGTTQDARRAARWLGLAANKNHVQAQALLGRMLVRGEHIPRQTARGLMWLTLARDNASSKEKWIADLYDSAFKQATDDERAMALLYLERWLGGRRE